MTIRVLMLPELQRFRSEESGIKRVVEAYSRYLPDYDVEIVTQKTLSYDLIASHAGTFTEPDVLHNHGLYWTADYAAANWEWSVNKEVIEAARHSFAITVPSTWVQEVFQRDMRVSPTVLPHGIEWDEWQHDYRHENFVLWNKNRPSDVCNPVAVKELAIGRPDLSFITTYAPPLAPGNVTAIGLQKHDKMKEYVQKCVVYLSTVKETFGIGVLEAMAAGVPVLGFNHGGNVDLVKHGVNGYLAEVNNYSDLAEGLEYCINHRKTLGDNGREMAKAWTWRSSCETIAQIYQEVLEKKHSEPTVSIVIPTFEYADKVGRAIESAMSQTYDKIDSIIVVDDGTEDEGRTQEVVETLREKDSRVRYVRQNNQGVAIARNTGVELSSSRYICPLDADDAIKPEFIQTCVNELEKDRSLGVAYTGLWYIKPDGEEGLSPWPAKYEFDAQLEKRNQVPTCCVFRRKIWERLGGYKQRYAPGGAGAEDAEFFLRMGAYGYRGEKVSKQGLFLYSWLSGRVSGSRDYTEVDWTELHPWTKDHQHPFVSVATPRNAVSHPVRQYDEPKVSVIIPVAPNHVKDLEFALDSLESQHFRQWEAIVVLDGVKEGNSVLERLKRSYPYPKYLMLDSEPQGAGFARNRGVEIARAPFLLFLDADDWLYPHAILKMLSAFKQEESIVYTDYVGKAFMDKKDAQNLGDRLLHYNDKIGEAVVAHQSNDYDCERARRQPASDKIYIWNLVTSLVPRAWHVEIGGFDEEMASWEDWDYWLRMSYAGKCFTRIPEQLVVYRFYTGDRREIGKQESRSLVQYLRKKFEDIPMSPCNCGNRRTTPQPTVIAQQTQSESEVDEMIDSDIVLIEYNILSRGQRKVVGPATGTFYGYRDGGERFYVNKKDAEIVVEFVPVPETPIAPTIRAEAPAPVAIPESRPLTHERPVELIIDDEPQIFSVGLMPGVTPDIAEEFEALDYTSLEKIASLSKEELTAIKGIGPARASAILDYAKAMLAMENKEEEEETE